MQTGVTVQPLTNGSVGTDGMGATDHSSWLRDQAMHPNTQKEQFSIAYVRAVCAVAGYTVTPLEVDDDSIDLLICAGECSHTPRRPQVDVQMKCSSILDRHSGEGIGYPLKKKNYEELRADDLVVPRILVVVVVPEDVTQWVSHSEDELALRHCGYWVSLRGMPDVANSCSVTVTVPRKQAFTPRGLRDIMKRINDGEAL